jgi:fructuronate reductase
VVSSLTNPHLNKASLAGFSASVKKPSDTVLNAGVGIVHLGLGAFHRAHQAIYTEDAMDASGGNWRIVGVSMRGAGVRDGMQAQDCLYSVTERADGFEDARIVGALADVLFAPEDPAKVVELIASPMVHVVTLTVTEKGYSHDPATGALMIQLPEIINDLDLRNAPKTALGYVVRGLKARFEAGNGPINMISCDNLPDNGRIFEGLVLEFCQQAAPEIVGWVKENVAFPCTMVDRIVPAATDDALDASSAALGIRDEMALQTEPFKQWVIEDKFTAPRPKWEKAGAQIVKNVAAYEAMKLRLLNGSHSTIAYLGYLGGHKTVSDAMAVPEFKSFVRQLMDEEVTPTLDIPKGFDATKYKDDLLGRFSNPTLAHKTWQIAMDGSQKLPQRLLGTLYQNMKAGKSNAAVGLAVAGWIQYVGGVDEQGDTIDVSDPYADELAEVHEQADGDVGKIVDGFLAIEKIFGPMEDQPKGLDFVLIDALDQLCKDGAMQCIANYC